MSEYPIQGDPTPFSKIYDSFWSKVTDDMMLEWTEQDTQDDLRNILEDAIPNFEFPRFPLYYCSLYDKDESKRGDDTYYCHLTPEEINILALCMLNVWLQRQITSIENTRQKYSGLILAQSSRQQMI